MDNDRASALPSQSFFPSLIDRLCDDHPGQTSEALTRRIQTWEDLREAVIRDLASLFNAVRPEFDDEPLDEDVIRVTDSVLGYGLPGLAGKPASSLSFEAVAEELKRVITVFEPRLIPSSLVVTSLTKPDGCLFNLVSFRIAGQIWAHPVPLEIYLRTDLDLESGQVRIFDTAQNGS